MLSMKNKLKIITLWRQNYHIFTCILVISSVGKYNIRIWINLSCSSSHSLLNNDSRYKKSHY